MPSACTFNQGSAWQTEPEGGGAHRHKLLEVGQVHVQDEVEIHTLPEIEAGLLPQVRCGHDARLEWSPAFAGTQAVLTWSAKSGGCDMHAFALCRNNATFAGLALLHCHARLAQV